MLKKVDVKFSLIIGLIVLTASFAFISGCSAGSSGHERSDSAGTFAMSVDWPDEQDSEEGKIIPSGTQTIEIAITGENVYTPVVATIPYSQTSVTIEEVPPGNNVATIRALDASGSVRAQRKESFVINSGETTTSGAIPLGIAIKGDSLNPEFEPSDISVVYGKNLYIQNWTDGAVTLKRTGYRQNLGWFPLETINIAAASEGESQAWTFGANTAKPCGLTKFTIDGKTSVGYATGTYTNYSFSKYVTLISCVMQECTFDPFNRIFATNWNYKTNALMRFDPSGYSGFTLVYQPSNFGCEGVCSDSSGNIYFSAYVANCVYKYNSSGAYVSTPISGYEIPALTIDANDYLYNTRSGNVLEKRTLSGSVVNSWSYDNSASNLKFHGVAVAKDGSIFVANALSSNSRIFKFNSAGTLTGTYGASFLRSSAEIGSIAIDGMGNLWVAEYYGSRVTRMDSAGNQLWYYDRPNLDGCSQCVMTAPNGDVWVGGYGSGQFAVYTPVATP